MITALPLVLLHELGHAVAARCVGARDITLVAGGRGGQVKRVVGGVEVGVAPVVRPWRLDGFVSFDAGHLGRAGILLIALAGPAASLLGAVLTGQLMGHHQPGSGVHALLTVATFNGAMLGLVSLTPMRVTDSLGPAEPTFASDGMVALNAFGIGLGTTESPSRRARHFGRSGWWAVVLLGGGLLLLLMVSPAQNKETCFLLFSGILAIGLVGLTRRRPATQAESRNRP